MTDRRSSTRRGRHTAQAPGSAPPRPAGSHRTQRQPGLSRWGASTADHPWRVVLTWAVLAVAAFLVAAAGVGGPSLFSKLSTGEPTAPGEATTGRDLLAAAEPDRPAILLTVDGVDLVSPAVATAAAAATADIAAIDGVADVASPFEFPAGTADPRAAAFVTAGSTPPKAFLMVTRLEAGLEGAAQDRAEVAVRAAYTRMGGTLPGASIAIGSGAALGDEIVGQMEADLRLGEGIALPLSFALMVVVFGGFVAAGMPIIGAVVSIGGALAALYGFSTVMDLDAATVNVVTLLGLALSIDYGLLFVSRAREELRARLHRSRL